MTTPKHAADPFEGFDVIEGFDPIDKAELVGKPFGVTGVRFRTNERSIAFAEVEIVTADGEPAAFQDASTGVRDQLANYLSSKGLAISPEWADVRLFVPRGLRVSTYDVTDDRGRDKQAKTYYLTTMGRDRGPGPAPTKTSSGGRKPAA